MPSPTTTRLLLPFAALALTLAACGGATDTSDAADGPAVAEADPAVSAPLPPAGEEGSAPVMQGMCVEDEPDCTDTLVEGDVTATCLAGAEDCADDPSGGVDVVRPVPLSDDLPVSAPMQREATNGATGAVIVAAVATDTGLGLAVEGTVCDAVEDVLIIESPEEVRVLVLTGTPLGSDCDVTPATRTVDVELNAPLGDRTLLDLAG